LLICCILLVLNGCGLSPMEKQAEAAKDLGMPVEKMLPKSGIVLRLIPAGKFVMGSPAREAGRRLTEVQHRVYFRKPFYMGKYEITQGQWRKVMNSNPSRFKEVGDNAPVENVSWYGCQEFISRLCRLEGLQTGSLRLPTEAEWEYACRAGTRTAFSYGNHLDSNMANCNGNYPYGHGPYRERTMPVGSFAPNAWGLYDMHGNVWEWCADWYGPYEADDALNPRGPSTGVHRVGRGGSYCASPNCCRSAYRSEYYEPGDAENGDGFRLVLPASQ
jgi:formylglycine-generating enzyme required for sulfatase activity